MHAELLDLYLESRHSDKDYLFGDDVMASHEVYTPLLARGWSHSVKTDGTQTFRSPDGLSSVRHRYTIGGSDDLIWRVCGGYPSEPHWQARFSHGAPTALAAAFTASLVSTEPLHRTVQDVPFHTRSHLYVTTTAVAKQPPTYSPAPPPAPPVAGRTR